MEVDWWAASMSNKVLGNSKLLDDLIDFKV